MDIRIIATGVESDNPNCTNLVYIRVDAASG